jgi:hypothetical protein
MSFSSLMCVAACVLIVALAAWLDRELPATPAASDLDVYGHAWLCGGPRRVALTLLAAFYQGGQLKIRPEPELDDFFLEVDPAAPLRGLELRARDLLWRMWGVRGATLTQVLPLLERLADQLRVPLGAMRLLRVGAKLLFYRCLSMTLALLPLVLLPRSELLAIGLPLVVLIAVRGGTLAMPLTAAGRDERARFIYRQVASCNTVAAVAARGAQELPVDLWLCLVAPRAVKALELRIAVPR